MAKKYKVAVDDGHGTNTPGKRCPDGYKENYFNHATKMELIAELKYNGIDIRDLSPGRADNSLQNRVSLENTDIDVDITISIHFNAMGNTWQDKAGGIETYYHGGSTKGKKLAQCVHSYLIKGTKLNNRGVKSDKILYTNGLYILRWTRTPAILVECGFMDNKKEAELMRNSDYRKECAREICQGICKYFGITYKDRRVTPSNPKKTYKDMIKELSGWSDLYIKDIEKMVKETGHNWPGIIEKLYYHAGKRR